MGTNLGVHTNELGYTLNNSLTPLDNIQTPTSFAPSLTLYPAFVGFRGELEEILPQTGFLREILLRSVGENPLTIRPFTQGISRNDFVNGGRQRRTEVTYSRAGIQAGSRETVWTESAIQSRDGKKVHLVQYTDGQDEFSLRATEIRFQRSKPIAALTLTALINRNSGDDGKPKSKLTMLSRSRKAPLKDLSAQEAADYENSVRYFTDMSQKPNLRNTILFLSRVYDAFC